MWQFMPSTGRVFSLKQNAFRDDRRDVLASTRAALDYLEKLGAMFNGDWQLALAAYNWGEGNVKRALQRKRDRNAPSAYESLRGMPAETRDYVPKLQAVKNIVARPEAFGLTLPPLENHPYFLSVAIERDIDVELAAKLAGMSLEEFQQLNPQMNRPVILAAGTPQVLLPYEAANAFVRNLPRHEGPLATWTVWVAPKTLKPAEAAELVGMSEAELRDVNRIPPSMLVQAGSSLVVPRDEESLVDVPEHLAENGHLALAPDTRGFRRVTFRAHRRGDSVAAVAQRYHVPAEHVAMWNHVGVDAKFRSGQNIVVMVAAKPAPAARRCLGRQGCQPGRQAQADAAGWLRPALRAFTSLRDVSLRRNRLRRLSAPIAERVRDRRQVDVLQLAAHRHAARQPRHLDAARGQRLHDQLRGGLALGCEAGGDDHFLQRGVVDALEQRRDADVAHAHAVERTQAPHQHEVQPAKAAGALERRLVGRCLHHGQQPRVAPRVEADRTHRTLR